MSCFLLPFVGVTVTILSHLGDLCSILFLSCVFFHVYLPPSLILSLLFLPSLMASASRLFLVFVVCFSLCDCRLASKGFDCFALIYFPPDLATNSFFSLLEPFFGPFVVAIGNVTPRVTPFLFLPWVFVGLPRLVGFWNYALLNHATVMFCHQESFSTEYGEMVTVCMG